MITVSPSLLPFSLSSSLSCSHPYHIPGICSSLSLFSSPSSVPSRSHSCYLPSYISLTLSHPVYFLFLFLSFGPSLWLFLSLRPLLANTFPMIPCSRGVSTLQKVRGSPFPPPSPLPHPVVVRVVVVMENLSPRLCVRRVRLLGKGRSPLPFLLLQAALDILLGVPASLSVQRG